MTILAFFLMPFGAGAHLWPMLLYIGPDVFLPLTSALAALAGVLLMFWHRIVGFVARLFGRHGSSAPPDQPGAKRD